MLMSKNLLQDMVKIEHIPTQSNRELFVMPPTNRRPKKGMIWIVALSSLVVFLFALSYVFASAIVTINPKTQILKIDQQFSASKDSVEGLSFDLVVISGEDIKSVPSTEQKEVAEKARGTVILYNNFGSSAQNLDIDTRLEGSNGKIYKTERKVTIPGKSKASTPGSVEVRIYAAESGPEYNSAPLDFKILGFKGTPKYAKFYGRSKSEITGGLKGKYAAISDEEKVGIQNELKVALRAKLLQKATDQIPSGFLLFKDAVFLNTREEKMELEPLVSLVSLKEKGTLYGILFNEEKLTKKIIEKVLPEYDGVPLYISNIKNLVFSVSDTEVSFATAKNLDFTLKGEAQVVWKLDADRLTSELIGKSKKEFGQVLSQYTNVDSADLALSPLWRRSLPDKIKNIKVIVNYPK